MTGTRTITTKIEWSGCLIAVQPRIRLSRSFDERYHSYPGYVLRINGTCGDKTGEFLVAVGKGAHEKHHFQAGMELSGQSFPVNDPRLETAEYYKTSRIKIEKISDNPISESPPLLGAPPDLPTYRERGHRRLDPKTYIAKCTTCIWGCQMPVEIIIDQWNPSKKKYRFETFCYGPKSCSFYRAGPTRKVSGRRGMTWEEENWIDEDATSHRSDDELSLIHI